MHKRRMSIFRQGGMATLVVSLILLLSLTIIGLTLTQSGVIQQRISGNDYRAKGVGNAAEAGLDYAISYLESNPPDWSAYSSVTLPAAAVAITLPTNYAINSGIVSGNGTYAGYKFLDPATSVSGVNYQVVSVQPKLVKVTAQAWFGPDSTVTAKVSEYVTDTSDITNLIHITAPPLVMKGCLGNNISGNPQLTTHVVPSTGILTTDAAYKAAEQLGEDCLDPSPHGSSGFNLACTDSSGSKCTDPSLSHAGTFTDAWTYYFPTITRTALQSLSAVQAEAVASGTVNENYGDCGSADPSVPKRTIYYLTKDYFSGNGKWQTDVGCPKYPVLLVFAADPSDPSYDPCNKINGGPTIYGVVFVDGNCPNEDGKGWGGTQIYGSLGINGNLNSFSSNAQISMLGTSTSTTVTTGIPGSYAPVPGTWKDWSK